MKKAKSFSKRFSEWRWQISQWWEDKRSCNWWLNNPEGIRMLISVPILFLTSLVGLVGFAINPSPPDYFLAAIAISLGIGIFCVPIIILLWELQLLLKKVFHS